MGLSESTNVTPHAMSLEQSVEPRPPATRSGWRWPLRVLGVVFVVGIWLFASIPWGLSAFAFLVFTAPGAVLGIATAWMSRVFERGAWSWRAGLGGALIGGSLLPPFLAFMVSMTGTAASPTDLLTLFVVTPWFALAAGVAIGIVRRLWPNEDRRPKQE
jgi:hypothetical protein